MFGSVFSFAGEIGMVSRGTGELDLSVVGAVMGADMAGVRVLKVVQVSVEGCEVRVTLGT